MCFFGDGTTNIGAFHEALNFAAVWKLPVVFVCENNLYMEYTPIAEVTPVENPAADRASAYGLESILIDGNDADVVYHGAGRLTRSPRRRGSGADRGADLSASRPLARRPGEISPRGRARRWMERDPITLYRERLIDFGVADSVIVAIEAEMKREVDERPRSAKPRGRRSISHTTSGRTVVGHGE